MRPTTLKDFIGNDKIKQQADFIIKSSINNNFIPPHILLSGAPSVGKTTMALILANELNDYYLKNTLFPSDSEITIYQAINDPKFPAHLNELKKSLLTPIIYKTIGANLVDNYSLHLTLAEAFKLRDDDHITIEGQKYYFNRPVILYIDEAHGIKSKVMDDMLILLEQFKFYARHEQKDECIEIPKFCCIASTTDAGNLTPALLTRFKSKLIFSDYENIDMENMTSFCLNKIDPDAHITDEAKREIAKRSKMIPRVLQSYLESCYNKMLLDNNKNRTITKEHTDFYFNLFDIDEYGLKKDEDIKVLQILASNFPKSVGLNSISEMTYIDANLIKKNIEPYLVKIGFVKREKTGRAITEYGLKYLKSKNIINNNKKNPLNPFSE